MSLGYFLVQVSPQSFSLGAFATALPTFKCDNQAQELPQSPLVTMLLPFATRFWLPLISVKVMMSSYHMLQVMNIGRLGGNRIDSVQTPSHLSGIVVFKNINRYTECLSISYLLWFTAVIASRGEKKVSLLKIGNKFQIFSLFPSNLF